MINNEYQRGEERANIRRLGEWGPPNVDSILPPAPPSDTADPEADTDAPKHRAGVRFNPAALVLMLLIFAAVVMGLGIAIAVSIGAGLTTLGLALFIVGFMMARNT